MNRFASTTLITLLGLAFSAATFAAKPEEAIKYRQGVMAAQGWNMNAMGAMVKGEKPYDKAEFAKRAVNLAALNKMALEGFTIEGSDKGETKAKPEIWTSMDKFKGGVDKLNAESAKLAQAAQGDDLNAIKAQFGEVGKVCKGCHDNFRNK
ncbi:MAG: cytochrome c [Pseudomonadota bacterium]